MNGRRRKTVMVVEPPGTFMKRVGKQRPDAGILGDSNGAIDGILKKAPPLCIPCIWRSAARQARTTTGMGSSMFRQTEPVAGWCAMAPATNAR